VCKEGVYDGLYFVVFFVFFHTWGLSQGKRCYYMGVQVWLYITRRCVKKAACDFGFLCANFIYAI